MGRAVSRDNEATNWAQPITSDLFKLHQQSSENLVADEFESMASTFVAAGEAGGYKEGSHRRMGQQVAPRSSWSAGAPKCVCAPPTHAGSFKCRLHRVKLCRVQSAPPLRKATPDQQMPAPDATNE
ncbi:hypothetical protein ZIOFF_027347 [Zingiber officinale]|uniref:Uncharacterized protein n=1 Tax=Zingiber officinale TaxID=94328 RepID=A0A8J5GSV0_ZINOF|nr:hypothetical protein ZIOFF_027347 [Zingiber officinale]